MKAFFKAILYQPLYNIFVLLVALIPGHNIGVAIIVLTVLVRLVLWPVRHKSIESQIKQRDLAPELKKLQETHKDDRMALSSAQMQMYKERGVNPASGCVTALIQFPILIILYYVFRAGIGPSHQDLLYPFVHAPSIVQNSFLWVKDLTKTDKTFILPVLAGLAQLLYSRSLSATLPPASGPNDMAATMSKQMLYLGPVSIFLFALRVPAGLSLYWAVASLLDWYIQGHSTRRFESKAATKNVTVSVRKKGDHHDK